MLGEQPHHQRSGVPSAGDQAAERTLRRRHRINVHGLRVVAPGEFHDLVRRHRDIAEFAHHADAIVLEITLVGRDRGFFIHGDRSVSLLLGIV